MGSLCGPHDTNRVVVPGVFVENLFRLAPVPDPSQFKTLMFIDFCLHTVTFRSLKQEMVHEFKKRP